MADAKKDNCAPDIGLSKETFDLRAFEVLAVRLGLKRTDGSIYGLLVLTERPLSSEEIENILKLSQSAVCIALKKLAVYNAIVTTDNRERRCKVHVASEDSLALAANIFRKREQQDIEDFKLNTLATLKKLKAEGEEENSLRMRRLHSIVSTCEIADAIMRFIITVGQLEMTKRIPHFAKRLPQLLELILEGTTPIVDATNQLKNNMAQKMSHSPLAEKIRSGINHFLDGH